MPRGSEHAVRARIVFEVEVEAHTQPINGLIRTAEREVEFVGWIGLAVALEGVLGQSGPTVAEKGLGWSPP